MSEQTIISFLQQNGPSIPAQLARHIGTSLLFASAMLGEVSSKGLAKVSALKIGGGSPLYYLKEHADQLQNFSDKLNPKDKNAFELIKAKKVLRDRAQIPLIRVALRSIKDFAVPLTIIRGDEKELFWKWYMISDKEAEPFIRDMLGVNNNNKSNESSNNNTNKKETAIAPADVSLKKKEIEKKVEIKKEPTTSQNITKKPIIKEPEKIQPTQKKEPIEATIRDSHINEFGGDLNSEFEIVCRNAFGKKVNGYFSDKKIKILNYEQLKKNKEFSFILKVPSAIGTSKYYSKAVDKKKIGEGDLALTLVEGQHRQLPVLFITNGELNKKTEEKINILFKDLNFIKI